MRSRRLGVVAAFVCVLTLAGAPGADAVVGGSQVAAGANRFMASLRLDGDHRCGASAIGGRWLLTAAHCVAGIADPGRFSVSLGSVNRTRGRVVPVQHVAVHPGYNPETWSNDAALLLLPANADVPAIRLANVGEDAYEAHGSSVRVAGWGSELSLILTSLPPLHDRMKQADLRIIGDGSCADIIDPATQLCAAALLTDSCQGDSGGPLWARTPTGPVQIGIVSFGFACAIPTFAGVYAEVNNPGIRTWIRNTAGV